MGSSMLYNVTILTQSCTRLQLSPYLSAFLIENLVESSSRLIPACLVLDFPIILWRAVVVIPTDLIDSLKVRVYRENRGTEGRLDADVFVAARMP